MNHELLSLIRETGYLTDAKLSDQARYDLLTSSFWRKAKELGYNIPLLRRKLWVAAGRPEEVLVAILPEAQIEKAVRSTSREKDPRKRILETSAVITLLYKRGQSEIEDSIKRYIGQPETLRANISRIRRGLLTSAATWLSEAVPGLYLMGSGKAALRGAHDVAARALATQEYNRFKEIDAQIGRHIEDVIAEAEGRRVKANLTGRAIDYSGLYGGVVGYKTIDGKELGLADYAKMLAITAARNFFNQGAENAAHEDGRDLMMISREVRSNSCQACRDWAGKIVSISGRSKEHPSLQAAKDENVFHPHCIHFLESVDEARYAGTGHYRGGAV